MNQTWKALANEAGLSAKHLALGSTIVGKAQFYKNAYYDLVFFLLSTGIERTSKLILVIDYLIKNNKLPNTEIHQNIINILNNFTNNTTRYYNRGNAKIYLDQYKEAIADYNEAIKFKADWADAHYNRGITKLKLGQHKEAIIDLEKATKLDSNLESKLRATIDILKI